MSLLSEQSQCPIRRLMCGTSHHTRFSDGGGRDIRYMMPPSQARREAARTWDGHASLARQKSALEFLSQLLRHRPLQDCAIPGLIVCPADAAVGLKSRDGQGC